jgi:large subunit ribosomal protein L15
MPLIRRLPKRGFNNTQFGIVYAPVNLGDLEKLAVSGVIDEKVLRTEGLVNGTWDGVKVLGMGEFSKKLSLKVNAISASAREKIEKAGGSVELVVARALPARNSAKQAAAARFKDKPKSKV